MPRVTGRDSFFSKVVLCFILLLPIIIVIVVLERFTRKKSDYSFK